MSSCPSFDFTCALSSTGPLSSDGALLSAARAGSANRVNDAATAPNRFFMLIPLLLNCVMEYRQRAYAARLALKRPHRDGTVQVLPLDSPATHHVLIIW